LEVVWITYLPIIYPWKIDIRKWLKLNLQKVDLPVINIGYKDILVLYLVNMLIIYNCNSYMSRTIYREGKYKTLMHFNWTDYFTWSVKYLTLLTFLTLLPHTITWNTWRLYRNYSAFKAWRRIIKLLEALKEFREFLTNLKFEDVTWILGNYLECKRLLKNTWIIKAQKRLDLDKLRLLDP